MQCKAGIEMRFFSVLFLSGALAFLGCVDAEKRAIAAEVAAHFKNYAKLKQNNPVAARGELYAGAYLLYKGHPKSKRWAEMVYKMDTAGEVSVSELLAFEVLLLEIAIDNGASKAEAAAHQKVVAARRLQIGKLEAEGKDPDAVLLPAYTFDFHVAR